MGVMITQGLVPQASESKSGLFLPLNPEEIRRSTLHQQTAITAKREDGSQALSSVIYSFT